MMNIYLGLIIQLFTVIVFRFMPKLNMHDDFTYEMIYALIVIYCLRDESETIQLGHYLIESIYNF
jgi:hypothetical protein